MRRGSGAGTVSGAVIAAVSLLLTSGCTSSSSSPSSPTSERSPGAAPGGNGSSPAPPAEVSPISWRDCEGGFDCGALQVPLDYAKPDGPKIRIAVLRKPATGPDRIGSLLLNPGGPGGSGIEFAQYAAASYPEPLRAAYDIVGFDPRGVGHSTAVSCLSDDQMDTFTQLDPTPDDAGEQRAWVDGTQGFAQACRERTGDLLGHVGTADAARDMDMLRAALGDDRLHYVGASYGTFLGATYAELFPSHVGRMVLDGAVDPSAPAAVANRIQGGGFETALTAFADDCVAGGGCLLGSTREAAMTRVRTFLADLDARPLPGDGDRKVTESIGTTGILLPLYSKDRWPSLRAALQSAFRGDGRMLLDLSDQYYERGADGVYSNLMFANLAVNCLDGPAAARTPGEVETQIAAYEDTSPTFGRNLAWAGLSCADWPVTPTGRPHEIQAPGAAPILVVGTTRDPATPYSWSQALAGQLESGSLLTYDGDGHTAFGRGSSCVDDAVTRYLIDGAVPADGLVCR